MRLRFQKNQLATPQQSTSDTQLQSEILLIKDRIFQKEGTEIYIGGEKITPTLRDVLKSQSESLKTSQLWEVIESTIINEANSLALVQSQNWEHVLSAKQLYHWQHMVKNIIHTLSK